MSIFTNIKEYKNRVTVHNLLIKLEDAHTRQDELSIAILLTKLEQNNIKIVVDKDTSKVVQ